MASVAAITMVVLVVGLTTLDHKLLKPSGVVVASLMWMVAPVFVFVRLRWEGWSYEEILWTISIFFLWVIVCGLGRPALLLDRLFKDKEGVPQHLILRSFIGQLLLIAGVIVLVFVATFAV